MPILSVMDRAHCSPFGQVKETLILTAHDGSDPRTSVIVRDRTCANRVATINVVRCTALILNFWIVSILKNRLGWDWAGEVVNRESYVKIPFARRNLEESWQGVHEPNLSAHLDGSPELAGAIHSLAGIELFSGLWTHIYPFGYIHEVFSTLTHYYFIRISLLRLLLLRMRDRPRSGG